MRKIIEGGGGAVEDVEYAGELARCCGFGGMIYPVDSELSQKISKRRGDESALPMITYCAGCRMALKGVGKGTGQIVFMNFSAKIHDVLRTVESVDSPRQTLDVVESGDRPPLVRQVGPNEQRPRGNSRMQMVDIAYLEYSERKRRGVCIGKIGSHFDHVDCEGGL